MKVSMKKNGEILLILVFFLLLITVIAIFHHSKTEKSASSNLTPTKTHTNGSKTPQTGKSGSADGSNTQQGQAGTEQTKPDGRTIYLTFDDGPTKYTPQILSILNKDHARATFFMLKHNMDRYPNALQEMKNFGFGMGCHGVTHKLRLFYASPKSAKGEMTECSDTLKQYTGEQAQVIRVPYGSFPFLSPKERQALNGAGFSIWDWNIDSKDWATSDPKAVVKNIEMQLNRKPGFKTPVILMHDKKDTAAALPYIIEELKKKHYQFGVLSKQLAPVEFQHAKKPYTFKKT
ncbi:polysaccharide deacetylase family protein [Heyndrickxia acidicola]|uniref:Polysaccharide deacetylase n=1 Tax=Heyndrickxia acidicola TaxID=209389 RepID=A0ABU6MJY3_9BACI|nr:polysaccharide deacetylase family protein [Heyndrickxia acidicola]MED1204663.1 polysaccharide deacetylase [Heyndrickxia acidicola]